MEQHFVKKSLVFALTIILIIKFSFPLYTLLGLVALFVFFQQLGFLILQLGDCIPYRSLFGVMMCLQMLVGPSLVYNGLEDDTSIYRMKIPQEEYFFYVLPSIILFLLGLYLRGNKRGELFDAEAITELVNRNKKMPFALIAVGFAASFAGGSVAGGLGFIFYLIQMFKFIGLFLLFFGDYKFKIAWLSVIFGLSVASSFAQALFHDLLTWIILAGTFICMRYKFTFPVKIGAFLVFAALAIFLQTIKTSYRQIVWEEGAAGDLGAITEASRKTQESTGGIFTAESISAQVVRINQGWIVASVMDNVPNNEPYANGQSLYKYFEAALLPRFLAPNKLEAGDQEIFTKYSGIRISEGTSMALSSVGDGYANFGIFGGWIFMFFYGLMFNYVIKLVGKYSRIFPALVMFAAIIFVYPIRPDCELQTILGHLVKASFLIFLLHRTFPNYFKLEQKAQTLNFS
ncbi:hypothetical protein EXU57_17725 [Segetibacter sp. 3557_3]|uniref:hypothetical protein n=1 Tax=Segetibacter sp. 3557_3 TaxID=2547429 RepID=UPI001058C442|nr:hypothetical protein [Segetibacter sp. 3557_3]TDH23312.1 hypothetical protein EXU57_17725 [Segetibacter sp. 3557_3]